MATDNRPLSPHLQIYRPQLTSVLSISHRITGIILSAGLIGVVGWFMAVASGPESYDRFLALVAHPIAKVALAAWTFALFYHLLNGIRHLLWDAHAFVGGGVADDVDAFGSLALRRCAVGEDFNLVPTCSPCWCESSDCALLLRRAL